MQRSQSNQSPHESSRNASHVGTGSLWAAGSIPNLNRADTLPSQPPLKDKHRNQERRRVLAYYSYALIVFNVYGIPLSFGPYLEYYYNSRFPTTSFSCLTAILACQVACLFCASALGPWLYRYHTFCATVWAAVVVAICFIICPHLSHCWLLLVIRGVLMGSMLGVLRSVGLLCLASHYNNNFPLVSMQSGSAAMLGAISYTALAWWGLRADNYVAAETANFSLSLGTLGVACVFLRKSKLCKELFDTTEPREKTPHKSGNIVFQIGYRMVFLSLFLWPTVAVVFISSPPSNQFPESGAYLLFATFVAAMASCSYSGSAFARRKLGPLQMLIISSLLAGFCTASVPWSPYLYVAVGLSCVYGVMLGAILTLHLKVVMAFHWSGVAYHPDMMQSFRTASALLGVCAGVGIFLGGLIVELTGGFKIALAAWGGVMIAGACLMALGRWKRVKEWRLAV
jgi:hypothetical protein